ncbi:hypothetical protein [Streptococcus sp. DD13]|uniref:hypothetical protein n=1 Tax=Streptococcus sp. DD13 TaxID=1777881 RepID=UPI0007951084|nr:hypothetical protein [Streptococcus sp. DD13]KXT78201.1 hypothetical protein STRDD13_00919 [Streptococcus sp. DD13]
MTMFDNRFPLLPDNEPVIVDRPYMNLYEETDLISNITGPYQEKNYGERLETTTVGGKKTPELTSHSLSQVEEGKRPPVLPVHPTSPVPPPLAHPKRSQREMPVQEPLSRRPRQDGTKSLGQLAREEAHEDIKRKRQAPYLQDAPSHRPYHPPHRSNPAPLEGEEDSARLSRLGQRLRQEQYILADMPTVYSLDKEDRDQGQERPRNSYDFLKKSQVYHYPERQQERNRQIAQELNLTQMEKENL